MTIRDVMFLRSLLFTHEGSHKVLTLFSKDKITNEEALRMIMGTSREMVRLFKRRNLQYLGHVIRLSTSQL